MLAAIIAVAFSLPAPAVAQEGAAGALLEEIVTVARKKSAAESVQDVPVAVTAFGAEQLDALFVTNVEDLSYVMPSVQLESVGTFPGVQDFSIPSVDPTVGVFVDGIFMGTTYGVVIDTFDLESAEILRGPQGLLFGRNATGGALLENRLAGKMVVYYGEDEGYYDNINPTASLPAPHPLQPFYIEPADGSNVGAMTTKIIRTTILIRKSSMNSAAPMRASTGTRTTSAGKCRFTARTSRLTTSIDRPGWKPFPPVVTGNGSGRPSRGGVPGCPRRTPGKRRDPSPGRR